MKKIIALGALAVLATNTAEASKARLLALGENLETAGSLYFSDNRNIFQNAAFIHEYKDAVYLEWGAQGDASTKADSDTKPQAEGGFLRSHGSFVYGLHVGAESYITHEARSYLRLYNNAKIHQDNQVDLFFGQAMSDDFKWGLNVTYSNTKDDADKSKQKSASVRLGVMGKKWEGYANVAVMNTAETQSLGLNGATPGLIDGKDKFDGKGGWELGGSYDLGFAKAFGYWRHGSWEQDVDSIVAYNPASPTTTPTGAVYTGKTDFDTNRVRLGLGRETQLNDRTTLFSKVEYVMTKREVKAKGGSARGTANIDDYYVPLTIGLEHDATSWLTLRGSVTQFLVSEQDNSYSSALIAPATPPALPNISPLVTGNYVKGKRSFQNSTNVNAGLTLKFGDLSIDGVIGTSTGAGAIGDTKSEKGVLSLDNLASRVAMTYRF